MRKPWLDDGGGLSAGVDSFTVAPGVRRPPSSSADVIQPIWYSSKVLSLRLPPLQLANGAAINDHSANQGAGAGAARKLFARRVPCVTTSRLCHGAETPVRPYVCDPEPMVEEPSTYSTRFPLASR